MRTDELEDRLRAALEHDAARVPLARPEWDPTVRLRLHRAPPPRRRLPATVAVAVFVAVLFGAAMLAARGGSDEGAVGAPTTTLAPSTASEPPAPSTTYAESETTTPPSTSTTTTQPPETTTTIAAPPVTLPTTGDLGPPVTVAGDQPLAYHRLAPDVDVAWIAVEQGTRLCWRTPAEERCVAEPTPGPGAPATVVVPSSAAHTVVLVLAVDLAAVAVVDVTTTAGDSHRATIVPAGTGVDIGIARFDLPAEQVDTATAS